MGNNLDALTIPIYLNTKIVFDMLATIEDGFSEVKNVQISSESGKETAVSADVGAANVFAFLNFGVTANRSGESKQSSVISEQRTYTPVSLFQKLKGFLEDKQLVKEDSESIGEGDFVELQGILKTNPMIDFLSNMQELMRLAAVFDNNGEKGKTRSKKTLESQKLNAQVQVLIDSMQVAGKIDVICETASKNVVVNTDVNYFINKNMSEITEGRYKILGKVTKICGEGEGISLLRNTAFSRLKLDAIKELQEAFNSEEMQKSFVNDEKITSVIEGPTMMVIPIAIYI